MTAAKAVALEEASRPEFKTYAKQIIANAKVLADELQKHGFRIVSGGTDNHLVLVDFYGSKGMTGKDAEKCLETVGLSVNKNTIPFDARKPLNPSGIRMGTPAATTRGMKEEQMIQIASLIHRAVENRANEIVLGELRQEVKDLALRFPIYP